MSDPVLDLDKLKAVKEWSHDLADELEYRSGVLPCKASLDRLGDCIAKQKRFLVEEMKPKRMCTRCRTRWHAMMVHKGLENLYSIKTNRDKTGVPNYGD